MQITCPVAVLPTLRGSTLVKGAQQVVNISQHVVNGREEWRPIPGYEDSYEVSNLGRVRRSGKITRPGRGRTGGARIGRVLKLQSHRAGYAAIGLTKDGIPRFHVVHRLVAAAFIGECPEGMEVNHLDGNKANNRVGNLEYVSHTDNMRHAVRTGLRKRTGSGQAKLTVEQVREILSDTAGKSARVVAEQYGVSKATIVNLRSGRSKYYWRMLRDAEIEERQSRKEKS